MKKYAIIEVEGKCGRNLEYFECDYDCCDCKYGDTKEQLIKKVEQAIFIAMCKDSRLINMNLAKEIIEFLGVEE